MEHTSEIVIVATGQHTPLQIGIYLPQKVSLHWGSIDTTVPKHPQKHHCSQSHNNSFIALRGRRGVDSFHIKLSTVTNENKAGQFILVAIPMSRFPGNQSQASQYSQQFSDCR